MELRRRPSVAVAAKYDERANLSGNSRVIGGKWQQRNDDNGDKTATDCHADTLYTRVHA